MSRARAVLALSSLLPVLLLAGCSDDEPEPKFGPTPSATAPSSASPSPSAPAKSKHQQQAALIDDFIAAVTQALGTGDPSAFLALTADTCQNCRVLADNLEDAFSDGGRIEGGKWELISSDFQSEEPLGSVWNVDVRSARERWLDGDGQPTKIVRAGVQHFGLAIEKTEDGWLVREMRLRA
ncbi:DUF6318 family protein [Nocardioides sp. URHA0020]|uniref:DUF6318 family protein n=1 Tax=Nocardioides sp. URHA0020 TaxID=1380392 RepID=UPI0012DCA460|nr:DUF6318 family protein [Nocardioides sp. URHA0020]